MTYILEYGFPKTYIYIIYTSHWLWINDKKHDRHFLYLWKTAFRNIKKNLRKWSFAFLALPFRGKFIALAGWLSLLILLLLLFIITITTVAAVFLAIWWMNRIELNGFRDTFNLSIDVAMTMTLTSDKIAESS